MYPRINAFSNGNFYSTFHILPSTILSLPFKINICSRNSPSIKNRNHLFQNMIWEAKAIREAIESSQPKGWNCTLYFALYSIEKQMELHPVPASCLCVGMKHCTTNNFTFQFCLPSFVLSYPNPQCTEKSHHLYKTFVSKPQIRKYLKKILRLWAKRINSCLSNTNMNISLFYF